MNKTIKLVNSTKLYIGLLAISLVGITGLSVATNTLNSKTMGIKNIESGVGICFQRLSQTFTALMIGELSSNFLSSSFKNTTEQCFDEVSKKINTLIPMNQAMSGILKSFSSDQHWFHNKTTRLVKMAQENGLNLSESNITGKFEDLESSRVQLEEQIAASLKTTLETQQMAFYGILLAQGVLLLSLLGLYGVRRSRRADVRALEAAVESEAKLDTILLLNKIGNLFNIPKTKKSLIASYSRLISDNENLEDALMKVSTHGETRFQLDSVDDSVVVRASVEFQKTLDMVLSGLKDKAFSSGVVIDTNLDESFNVYSKPEELEQFLYYALNFSIDSASANGSNSGGKITVTSKALGGISYCKVKIMGHTFSEDDLRLINAKEISSVNSDGVNINLILLKELRESANASIAVKNKFNQDAGSSELEVVFERAETSAAQNKVNIVKGSKKEIKRILEQNL